MPRAKKPATKTDKKVVAKKTIKKKIEPKIDLEAIKEELRTENLTDNEFKVGHSLVKILEEWRELFNQNDHSKNSTKFNKNLMFKHFGKELIYQIII